MAHKMGCTLNYILLLATLVVQVKQLARCVCVYVCLCVQTIT